KSMEGNPLNSSPYQRLRIYLPPEYFDNNEKSYPVIYILHGYGGYSDNLFLGSNQDMKNTYPLPIWLLTDKVFKIMPTFEQLDELIIKNQLPPFILVQPDASLPLPNKFKLKGIDGKPARKGSFYINSPFTGNYADYIFNDVIDHVDKNYRTYPEKQSRALIGGSMGGYGAIFGAINYSDKFQVAVALSPVISMLTLLNRKKKTPIYRALYGKKKADELGQEELEDILDSADYIFSHNQPLLPTLKKDSTGKINSMDHIAKENWDKWNLNKLAKENAEGLKTVELLINCEESDDFGLHLQALKFHQTLRSLGVSHNFQIYSNTLAADSSPHAVGIGINIIPGIEFCMRYIS
ncbi:MAG: alpha/beta hydrolase, partial [Promethearchaeota archaeon]